VTCHSFWYPSTSCRKGRVIMALQEHSSERSEFTSTPRRTARGFAAMDPQRQREIASLGGRAAHQSGHAHEFTSEEARAAGRKLLKACRSVAGQGRSALAQRSHAARNARATAAADRPLILARGAVR